MKLTHINVLFLFITLFISSCGGRRGVDGAKYVENKMRWKNEDLPITYKIPKKYYDQYRAQFENVEDDYQNAAGKELVRFIPVDEDPKYDTHGGAHSATGRDKNNMYIYFKDSDDNFKDLSGRTMGRAINDYSGLGVISFASIVLRVNRRMDSAEFRDVLLHEVGHTLGFQHITDTISVLNPILSWPYYGFRNNDEERIRQKYLLFAFIESYKDLEGMGAKKEFIEIENSAANFQSQFGLSEERSFEVAKIVNAYNKIGKKRALTTKDRNIFTHSLLGVDYKSSKKALESHIQGDENALTDILEKASDVNGISPEQVQELIGDYLLQ